MIVLAVPGNREWLIVPEVSVAYDVLGAMTALLFFGGWGLAYFHWGTRYNGSTGRKFCWAAILFFGMFAGVFLYWWFIASSEARSSDTKGGR